MSGSTSPCCGVMSRAPSATVCKIILEKIFKFFSGFISLSPASRALVGQQNGHIRVVQEQKKQNTIADNKNNSKNILLLEATLAKS